MVRPPLFLCLAILACVASAEPVVRNGDFREGLNSWAVGFSAAKPGSAGVDRSPSHDGHGALRIAHEDVLACTVFTQQVPVLPGREYVATAWLRADGIFRDGVGPNLTVRDGDGRDLGPPVAARFRQGSYDWSQVAVRFASGTQSMVALSIGLENASGTVWFDEVAIAPAPDWGGPTGLPVGLPPPRRLGPREAQDYGAVLPDLVSPHWAFGTPLRRRLRVAVLAPALAQRESVELAERFDCEVVPLMVHSGDALGGPDVGGGMLGETEALAYLKQKLKDDYDALVIARVEWTALGESLNRIIIEKTRAGMGLVYICPEGKRLTPDHPMFKPLALPRQEFSGVGLAGLPGFETSPSNESFLANSLRPYQVGKGRLLVVDYGALPPSDHHYLSPPTRLWRGGYAHYDLYLAFVGKMVRWVAQARQEVLIRRVQAPATVAWGSEAMLKLETEGAPDAPLIVELAVRRLRPSPWDPSPVVLESQPVAGVAELPLRSDLPMGDYAALVVLRQEGRVVDWGWTRYQISAPLVIRELSVPEATMLGSSASVPVVLELEGEIPPGAQARFEVHDRFGRLVGQEDCLLETKRLRVDAPCAYSRSAYNRVTVSLLEASGKPLFCQEAEFTIPRRPDDTEFQFVMSNDGGDDYIGSLLRQQAGAYGVNGAKVPVGSGDLKPVDEEERLATRERMMALARVGIAPIATIPLKAPGSSGSGRSVSLSAPAFRSAFAAAVGEHVAVAQPFSPLGLAIDGVDRLADCEADSDSHYGAWLSNSYGEVEAMNREWRTSFATFADARPLRRNALAGPVQWPRWVDTELALDAAVSDMQQSGREAARRVLPDLRVGSGDLSARDWWPKPRTLDLFGVALADGSSLDLARSFTRPGSLVGARFGGFRQERREPVWQRWAPWHLLLNGCNSAWFDAPYAPVGSGGEIGFRPDLLPYECWRAAATEIGRIQTGVDKLVLTSARDDGAILLVYSRSSDLVTTLDPSYDEHLTELSAMATLLRDCGFPFRVVAAEDLANGVPPECRVILLPACVAMSEAQARALREFAADGGALLADWGVGVYDEHGSLRNAGLLDDVFGISIGTTGGFVRPVNGISGLLPATVLDGRLSVVRSASHRLVAGIPVQVSSDFGSGLAVYLNFSLAAYPWHCGVEGAPLQQWLLDVLDRQGLPKPVAMQGQWGRPDRVETCRWQRGDLTILGFLKHPATSAAGEDLAVALPDGSRAYDLLTGAYLGTGKTVTFHLGPGEAKLVSLGPQRIQDVDIARQKGEEFLFPSFRIRVRAGWGSKIDERLVHVRLFGPGGFPYRAGTVTLVAPEGTCEYDVPFGLDGAEPGDWRLVAVDVATGVRAETTFAVSPPEN